MTRARSAGHPRCGSRSRLAEPTRGAGHAGFRGRAPLGSFVPRSRRAGARRCVVGDRIVADVAELTRLAAVLQEQRLLGRRHEIPRHARRELTRAVRHGRETGRNGRHLARSEVRARMLGLEHRIADVPPCGVAASRGGPPSLLRQERSRRPPWCGAAEAPRRHSRKGTTVPEAPRRHSRKAEGGAGGTVAPFVEEGRRCPKHRDGIRGKRKEVLEAPRWHSRKAEGGARSTATAFAESGRRCPKHCDGIRGKGRRCPRHRGAIRGKGRRCPI